MLAMRCFKPCEESWGVRLPVDLVASSQLTSNCNDSQDLVQKCWAPCWGCRSSKDLDAHPPKWGTLHKVRRERGVYVQGLHPRC